ncbi:SDR family NAD(P)-dependent oxidoreductase [Vagococcus sp. BWB3-3]|uniref:SDR family NAD(P)-dependent oxidoreductase n=2 Tax=Vagococcus allomyrinae TaxID=2794353 RepID=A0A940P236_9ENTE|nr:SDR family NAD(P)-dependent oxidoreductase [Vagococcus allomyrinae]
MEKWLDLAGKVTIVTGGSMGLGEKMCANLRGNGATVISLDVVEPAPENETIFMKCDISNKEDVVSCVKTIKEQYGKIDALINNAGVSRPRMLVDHQGEHPEYELSEADFDFMVNVNQKGVFLCSQAVAREMIKQEFGVIINMSSDAGLQGSEGQSCYSANKAAVHAFTMSWAKELGQFNIRVVGVAPSINERTPMNNEANFKALAYARGTDPSKVHSDYKGIIPLGRPGKMTEIADLISYLVSDKSSYISGTTINISGAKSTR